MKICVIGTGYVGLVDGACLAESGNDVICVDNNKEKVKALLNGDIPIYEPGLEDIVKRNVEKNRLQFTTDLASAVKNSLFCFIAVGTPPNEDGSADLKHVLDVAESIGKVMDDYKIIVDKSTVPVGTAEKVKNIISKYTKHPFDVVSNPEFLKEGAAVSDFMRPERIIIGTESEKAFELMQELYDPFIRTGSPIIRMDTRSAEMTKYAANAILATKISFMNEIANLCEKVGANINLVRKGIGSDSRIGKQFLFPGAGYGGSCFPKDVKALIRIAHENQYALKILSAVEEVNEKQKLVLYEKVKKYFKGNLEGKTLSIWGLAFKAQTDDMREASSIAIINALLKEKVKIKVSDPEALNIAKKIWGDKITYLEDAYECLLNSDGLLVITEWNEYRNPDFKRIKKTLKTPVIFDGRNLYDPDKVKEFGFDYFGIGVS
ncbi:MAG: UDP-glucose/GDP-mannose dehydrogenase family protein [Candidatus Margulisbacteria bacterium]|nr:UDP-glucose/GDP-mannose dehydrogenase family protein [Candidatus Margulisiibacteriota bacterium]